jgi:hypothetical protein
MMFIEENPPVQNGVKGAVAKGLADTGKLEKALELLQAASMQIVHAYPSSGIPQVDDKGKALCYKISGLCKEIMNDVNV